MVRKHSKGIFVFGALTASAEAGESTMSPFVFGFVGLGVLLALLVVTLMLKVER
jgi:hypothetical protein